MANSEIDGRLARLAQVRRLIADKREQLAVLPIAGATTARRNCEESLGALSIEQREQVESLTRLGVLPERLEAC